MKNILLTILIVLVSWGTAFSADVDVDVDSNNAVDLTYGGTNAGTAQAARANLGAAEATGTSTFIIQMMNSGTSTVLQSFAYYLMTGTSNAAGHIAGTSIYQDLYGLHFMRSGTTMIRSGTTGVHLGQNADAKIGFDVNDNAGGGAADFRIDKNTGYIAIGKDTAPTSKVDIAGNIKLQNNTDRAAFVIVDYDYGALLEIANLTGQTIFQVAHDRSGQGGVSIFKTGVARKDALAQFDSSGTSLSGASLFGIFLVMDATGKYPIFQVGPSGTSMASVASLSAGMGNYTSFTADRGGVTTTNVNTSGVTVWDGNGIYPIFQSYPPTGSGTSATASGASVQQASMNRSETFSFGPQAMSGDSVFFRWNYPAAYLKQIDVISYEALAQPVGVTIFYSAAFQNPLPLSAIIHTQGDLNGSHLVEFTTATGASTYIVPNSKVLSGTSAIANGSVLGIYACEAGSSNFSVTVTVGP